MLQAEKRKARLHSLSCKTDSRKNLIKDLSDMLEILAINEEKELKYSARMKGIYDPTHKYRIYTKRNALLKKYGAHDIEELRTGQLRHEINLLIQDAVNKGL